MVITVKQVLHLIRQSAAEAMMRSDIFERFPDGIDFVVVSPLAEGTDRLVAQAGIDLKYRLGAILPFCAADYEATFDLGDRAVAEFRALLDAAAPPAGYGVLVLDGQAGSHQQRDAAFMNCARAVARWSDILIAILSEDRTTSQTGLSVHDAMQAGVPVILIDPKQSKNFTVRHCADGKEIPSPDRDQRIGELVSSLLMHRRTAPTA